jgi:hypothetical protein
LIEVKNVSRMGKQGKMVELELTEALLMKLVKGEHRAPAHGHHHGHHHGHGGHQCSGH